MTCRNQTQRGQSNTHEQQERHAPSGIHGESMYGADSSVKNKQEMCCRNRRVLVSPKLLEDMREDSSGD